MNGTQKDAINKIVQSLTEADNERAYELTEQLDKQQQIHYLQALIRKHLPPYAVSNDALELAFDSAEFQELASTSIWDLLAIISKHEIAAQVDRRGHEFDEVA